MNIHQPTPETTMDTVLEALGRVLGHIGDLDSGHDERAAAEGARRAVAAPPPVGEGGGGADLPEG